MYETEHWLFIIKYWFLEPTYLLTLTGGVRETMETLKNYDFNKLGYL